MKKFLLLFAALLFITTANAQLNMTLRSTVTFDEGNLNDVWGWHHEETGKEYAIVGRTVGTSVVDVTDPDNPVEVGFFEGANSTWRDIKTWGDYAYVTNETGLGVAVLYLGGLPSGGELVAYNWEPNIPELGQLTTCHNIYIDEFGYAYLAGCNLNSGGVLIVDVFSEPGEPIYVSSAPAVYSHDAYVRDNILYSSEIYAGVFTIYDVTDKDNITALGAQATPYNFTHNAWLSDDGNTLFTTDERANAPIGSYDVSDPSDIQELDQFRPIETLGEDVIPHNVHVWQDWLIISYYTDGGIIVDASEPDNLIEVGNWDTFLGAGAGFNGSWGAYPFLPSETILLTDIGNGLFVCTPTYVRACRLEGTVTNAETNEIIANASVDILSDELNEGTTDFAGSYKTGIATSGTYTAICSAVGFFPDTVQVTLENGVTLIQDFALQPLQSYSIGGIVNEETNQATIQDANVVIYNDEFFVETTSNENGNFTFTLPGGSQYNILAAKWGYQYNVLSINLNDNTDITVPLRSGYQDDFITDLAWTSSSTASSGAWERGVPIGTDYNGQASNPGSDVQNDYGELAYVTGNAGGGAGNDDVDDGVVTLTSPVMDLSAMVTPQLSYNYWFFNKGGNSTPNDELTIKISNGTETVALETITQSASVWRPSLFEDLTDYITLTDNMHLIVETSDFASSGHLVEAGFDNFLLKDVAVSGVEEIPVLNAINVSPNPFKESVQIAYDLKDNFNTGKFVVVNQLGQIIETQNITSKTGVISMGKTLANGLYFARLEVNGQTVASQKILKVN